MLKKACNYCVYQERTQQEMRKKLHEWGASESETEEIIAWLITENFINESRYAKQFAGGKFRVKNWGKRKIIFELKGKGLSEKCISDALSEITDDEYFDTLGKLILQRRKIEKNNVNPLVAKQKTINFLVNKGYSHEDIHRFMNKWE